MVLSAQSAKANCFDVYEGKLLKQEVRRDAVIAISVGAGVLALSPIFLPLGMAVVGGSAVLIGGSTFMRQEFNKTGLTFPTGLKQYMILNDVAHPGTAIDIVAKKNAWLFGRRTGFHYKVPAAEQDTFLSDKFADSVQQYVSGNPDCQATASDDKVRAAVTELMKTERLCKNTKGEYASLSMNEFKTLIAQQICK